MRILPRSLFGRLLTVAIVTTIAALMFAAVSIGQVLERFVVHGLDERLDSQIASLAVAVRPDGSVDPARLVSPRRSTNPAPDGSGR